MNSHELQVPEAEALNDEVLSTIDEQAGDEMADFAKSGGRRSFLAAAIGAAAGIPLLNSAAQAGNGGGHPVFHRRHTLPRHPPSHHPGRTPRRTRNPYFVSSDDLERRFWDIFRAFPRFFEDVQQHENDHVDFLVTALGSAARPEPTFQNLEQNSFSSFVAVTQALENTGVGAYLGAAPVIDNSDFLAAAGSIATVEARHAGTVNFFVGDPVVPNNSSFDQPLSPGEVVSRAGGFVASLNGGPPLDYSNTPSASNDVAILNFALALEFLEAEFYNINVPKFFSQYL